MPKKLQKEDIRKRFHPLRKKRSRVFRWFVTFLVLMGAGALAVSWQLKTLEKQIEDKFTHSRRWNIPSRVYSDAEYLYPGVDVSRRGILAKLERLGYRQVAVVKVPGDFAVSALQIDIHLHDFFYPLEKFTGFPVRLELKGHAIERLVDLESGEELPLVKLEPEEIATLFDEKMEDRTLIALKECPPHLLEAIILVEDERFFKHHGVDPIAIARAALADLLHLRLVQGGSTLTQQLVKNFFLTSKKSLRRKFNEALMAILLEIKHSKAEILEAYLNEIYLGQRGPSSVTGVAEAAKHYFAKEVGQISTAEAALLAGMIRNPSEYSPIRSPEKARERRNLVLKKMLEGEVIDENAYKTALAEEINTPKPKIRPVFAPYFIDFLKQQIAEFYPEGVLQSEGLKIFTTLDMSMQLTAEEALTGGVAQLEKRYGNLLPKDHVEPLQGCLIAITPQNGYVRAMVGGRHYAQSQFNRCTQGLRQPGSTFKPFVYLTAFDESRSKKQFTPASLIEDKSFTVQTVQGPWTPENYDHREHGAVTLRTALENSYNIATARLAIDAGLEAVVQTAKDAGITSPLTAVPSLALGAFEVTPLELATAYTVFPNMGMRPEPLTVMNVMTPAGEVLEKKTLKMQRAFDPAPIFLTDNLMKGVMDRGTAASARSMGFKGVAAGKTGTTSNYKDAWFVGFTPELLALVWVGFDDNAPIQMSGARAALPIWTEFMKRAAGDNVQDFPFPEGLVQVNIAPECLPEYFIEGTEPEERCSHGIGKPPPRPRPARSEDF